MDVPDESSSGLPITRKGEEEVESIVDNEIINNRGGGFPL